jgi:hypothetical protein
LVGNVLDAFGDVDPSKIIVKMKLHLLAHLAQDIRRFGPAIRNSTEIFECFNGIFRLCSIYSNHQAPSRDIATKFASMDRLKHILAGGYWKGDEGWVRAGESVLQVLQTEIVIQRHLGWVPPQKVEFGIYFFHVTQMGSLYLTGSLYVIIRQYSPRRESKEPPTAMGHNTCFDDYPQSTGCRSPVAEGTHHHCTIR